LYTFLIYPVHSWPSHPPWFHHPNIIWWNIQVMELHIMQCNILHPPATSSLLGPNILLSILFSNTLNLCSSLSMRDRVSHPYKTTGKIMVLYISIFMF
jgi:hypothetical protein